MFLNMQFNILHFLWYKYKVPIKKIQCYMGANIFVIVPCFHYMGFYGTFTANVHLNDLNGSFTNERVLWNRTTCGVLAFFCQIGKHLLVKSITCNMTWFSGDI